MNSTANPPPPPPPPPEPTEREKLDFEREKFVSERDARTAEGQRTERDVRVKERQAYSRWTNPLMVAVVGAVILGYFNHQISKDNSLDAQSGRERQLAADAFKAENANVVEILKLNDPEKIKNGFCLLLKAKSLTTTSTVSAVQSYVDAHKGVSTPGSPLDEMNVSTTGIARV